jgi:glycosyltransferase involved in cell wall biosynthesis
VQFSVVIPTLGRSSSLLRDALESLAACQPPPDEIVVVDGSGEDAAAPVVTELGGEDAEPPIRYVPSPRGASVQRNAGIDAVSGEAILFIDDDAVADEGLFAALERAYRDPQVVGATGRVLQEQYRSFGNQRSAVRRLLSPRGREGTMTRYGYPRHLQDLDSEREVEFMQGCLMSARRDLAANVRFDTEMGGPAGAALLEDEDFSCRLARLGRVRHLPDAVVHHRAAGFRSRDARRYSRLIVVDRAYLFRKNFRRTPLARIQFALLIGILFLHRIVNREWGGVAGLTEGSLEAWQEGRSPTGRHRSPGAAPSAVSPRA